MDLYYLQKTFFSKILKPSKINKILDENKDFKVPNELKFNLPGKAVIGEMNKISGAPFDAFISLNYLELLPYPGAIIKNIYNNTSNNSVGIITVPNLVYLLKTKCFYEFVPDHLSYFTQKTLTYAFESNGFEVLESSIINEQNDIAVIVIKRISLNISDGIKEVKSLIQHLREISEKVIFYDGNEYEVDCIIFATGFEV